MWRRRHWRHLVVTCQNLTEKLREVAPWSKIPKTLIVMLFQVRGFQWPIQHAWCLQSQTDSSFLFFTPSLSSWKPACRLRPRSTGPVNHREINGFQKTACVTAHTATVWKTVMSFTAVPDATCRLPPSEPSRGSSSLRSAHTPVCFPAKSPVTVARPEESLN